MKKNKVINLKPFNGNQNIFRPPVESKHFKSAEIKKHNYFTVPTENTEKKTAGDCLRDYLTIPTDEQ